mmetsp:Transcript_11882/g.26827  ORF Transcript_11882/g.26827 Transcript_11882/m.26827 type:complete len:83 (+) Transcript_11882:322-570(+)
MPNKPFPTSKNPTKTTDNAVTNTSTTVITPNPTISQAKNDPILSGTDGGTFQSQVSQKRTSRAPRSKFFIFLNTGYRVGLNR